MAQNPLMTGNFCPCERGTQELFLNAQTNESGQDLMV